MNTNRIIFWLLLLLAVPVSTTLYGQQKRILTPEDYKLWSTLQNGLMSNDGNWVSYRIVYKGTQDTLYLKETNTDTKYSYPAAILGAFSPDSKWFACKKDRRLQLINLQSGKTESFENTDNFVFTAGNCLLLYTNTLGKKTIELKDLTTFKTKSISNVRGYSLNPNKTLLGFITEKQGVSEVSTITLGPELTPTVVLSDMQFAYTGLSWNKSGTTLAFYGQVNGAENQPVVKKLYVCNTIKNKPLLKVLDLSTVAGMPTDSSVELEQNLYISDDSKQLFFYIQKKAKGESAVAAATDAVQVWSTDDDEVPPAVQENRINSYWYVWWIDTNKILAAEDDEYPNIILTGDQKNALVYNTHDYPSRRDDMGDYIDVYLKDMVTGNKKLLLRKQPNQQDHLLVSPAGKYVTYFKDKNWWVYDIKKQEHRCMTAGLLFSFEDKEYDLPDSKPPYGNPGWLDNDEWLIVYDQFDIWLMTPDGSKRERITDGWKTNTVYRIYKTDYSILAKNSFFGFVNDRYSSKNGMLITTLNKKNLEQGFCHWDEKSGLTELVKKDRKLSLVSVAALKPPLLYMESDFDVAPRLMLLKPSGEEQVICQSNPQQKNFYWGRSELINYTINGKQLKAALFYPAGYVPGKKYPMIVSIYEKKSSDLHKYNNPTQYLIDGFNPTNYTAEGYFVLSPDIVYELNDPGISATRCVVAAVEKVLEEGSVARDRIGLFGFSFGGYEAAFIITKTDLFRTSVSGDGITDPADHYLSLSSYGESNIPHFENGQYRIQTPFYGSDFIRNSTIANVQYINTPLLLFTGGQDQKVNWTQSRKLQIALWRLHKISTFLVYPGETHGIHKEANQKDLTIRVKNWFDYYLKDVAAADSIKKE